MEWNWQKFYDKGETWLITTGPRIIIAILVLIIGFWLIRKLNKWVKIGMERKKINPSLRYFFENLLAISLQIFLIFFVLQVAGIQLTFLTAIIAGLSVTAGLALSGTLQNFVSGILILLMKPFKVGDIINTQSQEGTVTTIQIFYTTVLTYDNKTILVPNGQLSNNVVINLSKEGKRRLDLEIKFGYNTDYEKVKSILLSTLNGIGEINTEEVPRIGVSSLDTDKYAVSINVWVASHGFTDLKLKLQEMILKNLIRSGIKLPGT
ncbi:MAG: Ion channel protein [Chitinophagaceae bacterium]|nr:Ion channel protein [Chitinophagaceae bacterium]